MGRQKRKRTIQRRSVCKNNISRKRKRKNNTSKRTKQRKKRTKQRQKRRMVGGDDEQELRELKKQIKELKTQLLGETDVPETGGLPPPKGRLPSGRGPPSEVFQAQFNEAYGDRPSGRLPSGLTSTDPQEQFEEMQQMNMKARENAAKKEAQFNEARNLNR